MTSHDGAAEIASPRTGTIGSVRGLLGTTHLVRPGPDPDGLWLARSNRAAAHSRLEGAGGYPDIPS